MTLIFVEYIQHIQQIYYQTSPPEDSQLLNMCQHINEDT